MQTEESYCAKVLENINKFEDNEDFCTVNNVFIQKSKHGENWRVVLPKITVTTIIDFLHTFCAILELKKRIRIYKDFTFGRESVISRCFVPIFLFKIVLS